MAWTSPKTWTTDEVVTAAALNLHLRDNLRVLGDAWTAYTPTWTATTTNPTIGNGTISGNYVLAGKFCTFRAVISLGSTTSIGSGTYSIGLPATVGGAGRMLLDGVLRDTSASADYPICGIVAPGSTSAPLRAWPSTAGNPLASVMHNSPITVANGDSITITGTYEVS